MTHSEVWYDSLIPEGGPGHQKDLLGLTNSCVNLLGLTHSCGWGMTHPCVCGTWLIHKCEVNPSYVRHDSFRIVTWPILKCDMTHSHLGEIRDIETNLFCRNQFVLPHSNVFNIQMCEAWLIHMWSTTHSDVRHDSSIPGGGQRHLTLFGLPRWRKVARVRNQAPTSCHIIWYNTLPIIYCMWDMFHSHVRHASYILHVYYMW